MVRGFLYKGLMHLVFDKTTGRVSRATFAQPTSLTSAEVAVGLPASAEIARLDHVRDLTQALAITPTPSEMPALWLRGHFCQNTSLGHVNREIGKVLLGHGHAVHLMHTEDGFDNLYLPLAERFPQHEPLGRYFSLDYAPFDDSQNHQGRPIPILWDMIDSYRCGNLVPIDVYNRHALTLTLSEHSRSEMQARGVRNAVVVPCGVDRRIFHPHVRPMELSALDQSHASYRVWGGDWRGKTIFLFTGFLQEKKAVAATVAAFNEFYWHGHEDCVLLIKNTASYWGKDVAGDVDRANRGANIVYTEQPLTDTDFVALLAASDVVVQMSHCEGFGLIPLQAMAMDKPVVVTDFSGFTEYATHRNASLVPVFAAQPPYAGFPYASFTAQDGARAFEDALKSISDPVRRGARLATAEEFSWERSAKILTEHLAQVERLPLRPMWKPKLQNLVTLVIAAKGGKRDIDRLLTSFSEHETWPYEVVVLDDGSDPPLEVPGARVYRLQENGGAAQGRNRAFMEAQGEYIFGLDTDIEITGPVLRTLVECLGSSDDVVLAPKLLYRDGLIQSAGGAIDRTPEGLYSARHRFIGEPATTPDACISCNVQYAPAAAHFFRRTLLERVGLYWEAYEGASWDDVHFCYHLRSQGVHVRYTPIAEMVHREGQYNGTVRPQVLWNNSQRFLGHFPNAEEAADAVQNLKSKVNP